MADALHGRSRKRDIIYMKKNDERRQDSERGEVRENEAREDNEEDSESEREERDSWYLRQRPYVCIDVLWAPWYQRDRLYNEPYTVVYSTGDLTDVYISVPY